MSPIYYMVTTLEDSSKFKENEYWYGMSLLNTGDWVHLNTQLLD